MVAESVFQQASGNLEIGRAEEVEDVEDVIAWQDAEWVEEYEEEDEEEDEDEDEEEEEEEEE